MQETTLNIVFSLYWIYFSSIAWKAVNLYRNTLESVPGINQHWAISVKFLAQENNNFNAVTISIFNPITRCRIFFMIYGSWSRDRDILQLITWYYDNHFDELLFVYINVNKCKCERCILKIVEKKMINRINRIIGLVPLNGKILSGSAPDVIRFACGSPNKFLLAR